MSAAEALGRVAIIIDLDGNAEPKIQHLGSAVQQLEQRAGRAASGGMSRFASAFGGIQSAATRLMETALNPLSGLFGGLLGSLGVGHLIEVNNEFETTRRALAGTLETLGLFEGSFTGALGRAGELMQQISTAAAALPGEAEDYVHAFQGAVPQLQQAAEHWQAFTGTGMSGQADAMSKMVDFTNRFMAIGIGKGLNAGQLGLDLTRFLAQGKGAVEQVGRTWMTLAPYIGHAAEAMGLHVERASDFNRLTLEQRANLLENTVNAQGLVNVIQDASTSWDAQMGALASISKQMLRLASNPLFEKMKTWLGMINSSVVNSEGGMTAFGNRLVRLSQILGILAVAFTALSIAMSPVTLTIVGVAAASYGLVVVWEELVRIFEEMKSLQGSDAPQWLQSIITFGYEAYNVVVGLWEVFSSLSSGVGTMSEETYNNLQGMGLLDFVIDLASGFYRVWQVVSGVFEGIWSSVTAIWNELKPIFSEIGTAIGGAFGDSNMFQAAMDFMNQLGPEEWRAIGQTIGRFVVAPIRGLIDMFRAAYNVGKRIGEAVYGIVQFVERLKIAWDVMMGVVDMFLSKVLGMLNNPAIMAMISAIPGVGPGIAAAVQAANAPPVVDAPSPAATTAANAAVVGRTVGGAAAAAAAPRGGNTQVFQQAPIRLELNGRVLAEQVVNQMQLENARLGVG